MMNINVKNLLTCTIILFAYSSLSAMSREEKEAFLMGQHPRLGAESEVRKLPQEVAQQILKIAEKSERIELRNLMDQDTFIKIRKVCDETPGDRDRVGLAERRPGGPR